MFHDHIQEHTPEWTAIRAGKIGGSEVAALFGCQPDWADSAYSLHYVKSGKVKPDFTATGRARFGLIFEPGIARAVAEARGWRIRKGRYCTDDTTPGMGASLDYEVEDAGGDADGVRTGDPLKIDGDEIGKVLRGISGPLEGPGVFQIKRVNYRTYKEKWFGSEPPDYILLQVQQELACSGYKWACVGAQITGDDTMALYFYPRRELVIDHIRQRITEFWVNVEAGKPPPVDGSDSSARVLRELFPRLEDNENEPLDLTADNEMPEICADVASWSAVELDARKKAKAAKAKLKAKMGTATFARCQGWFIKCSVTPAQKPRHADPGELIGGRSESRKYTVTEDMRGE